jgi:hypothetical protein
MQTRTFLKCGAIMHKLSAKRHPSPVGSHDTRLSDGEVVEVRSDDALPQSLNRHTRLRGHAIDDGVQ